MTVPQVLVLRAPGTNCDVETAYAFELAGGRPERVHISRLLENPARIHDFQILCIPGGFSFGDDLGAGRILASKWRKYLRDALQEFHAAGKLMLGICNGFQVLMKTGMLLAEDAQGPVATLTWNNHGRYEARWVKLRTDGHQCVFLRGIDEIELPMAHAEGRFVTRGPEILTTLRDRRQLALRYCDANGSASNSLDAPLDFPANPNGSQANVAGVCDPTGRIFGLMPHPERFVDPTHHPRWTREPIPSPGLGLRVFTNAVEYFA